MNSLDITQCPHCNGDNIIDRYDMLYELGQTANGCSDPIWYCLDCQRYCQAEERKQSGRELAKEFASIENATEPRLLK